MSAADKQTPSTSTSADDDAYTADLFEQDRETIWAWSRAHGDISRQEFDARFSEELSEMRKAEPEVSPCANEGECTYQPFCRLNGRCMKMTAVGPVKHSRNLQPKKRTTRNVKSN